MTEAHVWLARVRELERTGELLHAYDTALFRSCHFHAVPDPCAVKDKRPPESFNWPGILLIPRNSHAGVVSWIVT